MAGDLSVDELERVAERLANHRHRVALEAEITMIRERNEVEPHNAEAFVEGIRIGRWWAATKAGSTAIEQAWRCAVSGGEWDMFDCLRDEIIATVREDAEGPALESQGFCSSDVRRLEPALLHGWLVGAAEVASELRLHAAAVQGAA